MAEQLIACKRCGESLSDMDSFITMYMSDFSVVHYFCSIECMEKWHRNHWKDYED